MPPKRRRTSESAPSKDDEGSKNSTKSGSQPHDKLWFGDGNIVLATDVHLYRVYKGMLAKYSKVLSDIFEMPTGGAAAEFWEDVPMVQMVGDKDEEVSVLLKALYERNFRDTLKDFKIRELSSLLSISTKYDFIDIRADVMQHLTHLFPNKLTGLGTSRELWKPLRAQEILTLLAVAHRCEALSILPVLYHLCATFPINQIIQELHIVQEECMKRILRGRDMLRCVSQVYSVRIVKGTRDDGYFTKKCQTASSQCLKRLRAKFDEKYTPDRFILVLEEPDRGVLEGLSVDQSGVCDLCASVYTKDLKQLKADLWEYLPLLFLDKKWEELCDK